MAVDFTQTVDESLQVGSPVITAAPFTFAGWASLDNVTSNSGCFIAVGTDSGFHWFFIEHENSEIRFNARDASNNANATSSGLGLTTGTWFHFAGVARASNDRETYHNGTSVATNTTTVVPVSINTTGVGVIPQGANGFDELNGQLEHCAIWSAGLTDEEIQSLAAGVNPMRVRPGSLVAYWPLYNVTNLNNAVDADFTLTTQGSTTPTTAGFGAPVQPFGMGHNWQGNFTAAAAGGFQAAWARGANTVLGAGVP